MLCLDRGLRPRCCGRAVRRRLRVRQSRLSLRELGSANCAIAQRRAAWWLDDRGFFSVSPRFIFCTPVGMRLDTTTPIARAFAALVLGASTLGCVGYDDGADAASFHAASLGVTAEEENAIRGVLALPALNAEEIALTERLVSGRAITANRVDAMTAELEKWERMPEDQRTMVLSQFGRSRGSVDGSSCVGDINCGSKHCGQAGICLELATFKPDIQSPRDQRKSACAANWECRSSRCELGFCMPPRATDADGVRNVSETDVDCGGPVSPYACPLGGKCQEDDDCVAGYCLEVVDTSVSPRRVTGNVCVSVAGNTTDVGRLWQSAKRASSRAPYPTEVTLPNELAERDQQAAVRSAPQLYTTSVAAGAGQVAVSRLVAAEQTRVYQHDTCAAHLVANGCSPAVFQAVTSRKSGGDRPESLAGRNVTR